jgi:hypothetical protein
VLRTFKAVVDEQGNVRLLEPIQVSGTRQALVTILDEEPVVSIPETALLSEPALGEGWDRPEEDAAWSHLQQAR